MLFRSYPFRARPNFSPHPIIPAEGVCEYYELSHDGGEGEFRRLAVFLGHPAQLLPKTALDLVELVMSWR